MRECVGAIIVQQKSVLLGKRTDNRTFFPNVWDVFGGHVEPGESHLQALERELVEELGIIPTKARYLETLRIPGSTKEGYKECYLYIVSEWNGTPVNQQPQEHSEIRWFRFGEISRLELATPEYRRIVEDAWRQGEAYAGA